MPDRLVLHIGPHKTGTTAIQFALRDAAAVLEARGWHYPLLDPADYAQHRLPNALARGGAEAEAMLDSMLRPGLGVILSSENFSRLQAAALARLAERLRGWDVSVVYYQRNFLSLAYSWWQERVKHGRDEQFPEYMAKTLSFPGRFHLFGPGTVLGRFAAAFGREAVRVYLYDVIREAEGVTRHFGEQVLGLEPGTLPEPGARAVNASLGPGRVELLRALNSLGKRPAFHDRGNAQAEAARRAMDEREGAYRAAMTLSYEMPAFRQMERQLLERWSDRILSPLPEPGLLFRRRELEVSYVTPTVWLAEPELGAMLRAL